MRILTAIPVYNEEAHLEPVLEEVLRYTDDVLAVDDGSTDRTPELLRGFPKVRVIRHEVNRGYGAGLDSMFRYTVEQGFDGLVTIDCDGQHEPKRIPEIASGLDEADIVSGSRYLRRCSTRAQVPPIERRRINVEVTRWLNECLGLDLTDAFCGFKAYRASALGEVRDHRLRLRHAAPGLGASRGARDEDRRGAGPLDLPRREAGLRRGPGRRDVPAQPLPEGVPGRAGQGGRGGGGGLSLMHPHRLRAPSSDGALLADPALGEAGEALDANASRLNRWDHDFQGRRADRLRGMARVQVMALAKGISRGERPRLA